MSNAPMQLELSLSATKLKNVAGAFHGKSDPFAVVTKIATKQGAEPEVLGKTEVIKNTLNPDWVKVFEVDYVLGSAVQLAVSIFDEEKNNKHKPMGTAIFDVGELLGARGNTKAKQLKSGGTIFATVSKAKGSGLLRIDMKASKLKNVEGGFFTKSDPFYEFYRKVDTAGGKTWDNVFRSEVVRNNLNPDWKPATIELRHLCGGDLDLPIKISVFDFEHAGNHAPMGSFETTVNALVAAAKSNQEFTLMQKGKDVGKVMITSASIEGVSNDLPERMNAVTLAPVAVPIAGANFVDYVSGGCELNVVVAIDFTGSNGDPRTPDSLHYLHTGQPNVRNDYEKAISAIVGVLSKYDSDQMYPVYGFGAKYGGVVRHCFQCGPTPEVRGVDGVLDAYHKTFSSGLTMSGPTVFTEVIDTASRRALEASARASQRGGQAYTILLIITDGAVTDPPSTADAFKRVVQSPLSVVIVGVGNADFSSMRFLDDCFERGQRDVVQFVEFNRFAHSSVALTEETLKEIPDQVVGHFKGRGIAPLPPIHAADHEIAVEPEDGEIDLSLDIQDHDIFVTSGGRGFVDSFNASR